MRVAPLEQVLGFRPSSRATTARTSPRRAAAISLDREVPGSGRHPLERDGERRLTCVKRVEILNKPLTGDVPAIIMRQKIKSRRVARFALEEDTEVRVAQITQHQA
jgi:hypothetical protein